MKVYQVQPGAGLDGLSIDERPEPTPAPRQVLIKVKAVSLNDRDLLILKGLYPGVTRPVVPVSDGMGEVVALGEGVTRVKVGDRVIGTFFQRWIDGPASLAKRDVALGGTCDGLLAEYALLDAEGLVLAPDHLSDEEASYLPDQSMQCATRAKSVLLGYSRAGLKRLVSPPSLQRTYISKALPLAAGPRSRI